MIFYFTILLFFFIILILFYKNVYSESEGFQPEILAINQKYPREEDDVLLKGDYPLLKKLGLSKNSGSTIWQDYPIFEVGSYAQMTNNIRYPDNPDDGQCMPAEFCGSLYKNKRGMPSNNIEPLGPVPDSNNARVNYYNSQYNLLPFHNEGNILY
jgi:hypothetical protein